MPIRAPRPQQCWTKSWAVLIFVCLAACIQRPTSVSQRREAFDRTNLSDVIVRDVPATARPVHAVFGEAVELVGMEVDPPTAHPGEAVQVTYYLRVQDEPEEDYMVFVHADELDERGHGGSERIHADHFPASGRYPTGVWRKGEVVRDVWTLKVPSSFRGEAVALWTGFYPPGKDDRWPLTNPKNVVNDGQNRVRAGVVPVR